MKMTFSLCPFPRSVKEKWPGNSGKQKCACVKASLLTWLNESNPYIIRTWVEWIAVVSLQYKKGLLLESFLQNHPMPQNLQNLHLAKILRNLKIEEILDFLEALQPEWVVGFAPCPFRADEITPAKSTTTRPGMGSTKFLKTSMFCHNLSKFSNLSS